MAGGERGKRVEYPIEKFHLLIGNRLGEAQNPLVLLLRDRRGGELFEARDEGSPEAAEAIAVLPDGFALSQIQLLSHLFP